MKVKLRLLEERKRRLCTITLVATASTRESRGTFKFHMAEHRQAVQKSDPVNGIVVHVAKSNHGINWPKSKSSMVSARVLGVKNNGSYGYEEKQEFHELDRGIHLPSVRNSLLDQT